MRIASVVALNLLFFLALSSGIAKILQLQQEMEFFQEAAGLSANMIIALGSVQLLAGILLLVSRTRIAGAATLLLTFLGSSALIFMNGQVGFGVFSLLAVALAAFVIYFSWQRQASVGRPKNL